MALEDDIATLARAPLLDLMERDALRLLAFAGEQRGLRQGEVLFRKGEPSDGGYVVMRGTIVLDAGSAPAFSAERSTLIARTALFVPITRPATATAREPSGVLRIAPALMRRVLEEFPGAAEAVREAVAADLSTFARDLERVRRRLDAIGA
jgi:CRP-like cAMP-binding protein